MGPCNCVSIAASKFTCETYQMKLLNPSTRIAIPVNWTTSVRFEWKASINWGNIGAKDKGPMPTEGSRVSVSHSPLVVTYDNISGD